MSYRRTLTIRWSTRDRLAVLGIAVAGAAVVGSVLLLSAIGAETTRVAQSAQSNATVTLQDASTLDRVAGQEQRQDAVVYPVAVARTTTNRTVRVVGLPNRSDTGRQADGGEFTRLAGLPPPRGGVRVPPTNERLPGETVHLSGADEQRTLTVQARRNPSGGRLFPPQWYVTDRATVEQLGVSAALVVRDSDVDVHERGVGSAATGQQSPLVTGLAFFEAGTQQLLDALWVVVLAAAVLTGVVVFSVTRMSVRDRIETLQVIRATGAPPRSVLTIVALRAGLLTGAGVLIGYALGTVGTRAAVVLAAYLGVPTTLDPQVTPAVAARLIPTLVLLLVVGTVAGAGAARRVVRQPPAALLDVESRRGGYSRPSRIEVPSIAGGRLGRLQPDLPAGLSRLHGAVRQTLQSRALGRRAAVPTAATLGVFVAVALVVVGAGATLAPPGADGGTVVQPGASNPLTSRVDVGQATALRAQGAAASPEVIVPAVVDGRPVLARGADFSAFATVTDARLVSGRGPAATGEAVVGVGVARQQGLSVGDRLALGGPSSPRVAVVEVVGTYRAPGVDGAGIVMPLATARHLTSVGPGQAHVVRVDRPPEALNDTTTDSDTPVNQSVIVTDLAVPETVRAGEPLVVDVTVENVGGSVATQSVTATAGDRRRTKRVTVEAASEQQVRVQFPTAGVSTDTLTVTAGEELQQRVQIIEGAGLRLGPLPATAPSDAQLRVLVTDADGQPVPDTTVTVSERTARTDTDGVAVVTLPSTGPVTVTAQRGEASVSREFDVRADATRLPVTTVSVTPSTPTVVTRPTANVDVHNPWPRPIERQVRVTGPDGSTVRSVSLPPGESTTVSVPLERASVGDHEVTVSVAGRDLAWTSYRVQGDRRAVAAAASSGRYVAGSDLGQGITSLLGNIELLLGALLTLAALATVGTATAGSAAAVHATRQTIGIRRATGANPWAILRLVLADTVRVCCVAVPPALLGGYLVVELLSTFGLLTAFGVTLVPSDVLLVLLLAGLAALGLALVGATLATLPALRAPPAALLDDVTRRSPPVKKSGGDSLRDSDETSPSRSDDDGSTPRAQPPGGESDA